MSTDNHSTPAAPGQEPLAEIARVLGLMSPADLRERLLRDLSADVDQGLADVYLPLLLLAQGRALCSPDYLRRLAEKMRGAAGSIDLFLDMLARAEGRQ